MLQMSYMFEVSLQITFNKLHNTYSPVQRASTLNFKNVLCSFDSVPPQSRRWWNKSKSVAGYQKRTMQLDSIIGFLLVVWAWLLFSLFKLSNEIIQIVQIVHKWSPSMCGPFSVWGPERLFIYRKHIQSLDSYQADIRYTALESGKH